MGFRVGGEKKGKGADMLSWQLCAFDPRGASGQFLSSTRELCHFLFRPNAHG